MRSPVGASSAGLIELLELQGIVQASLGAHDKALAAARPAAHPRAQARARRRPRAEGEGAVRRGDGPARPGSRLRWRSRPTSSTPVLRATVVHDPLKLARAVRFHLRSAQSAWETRDLPADAAQLTVPQVQVEWYAELLDAASDVLARAYGNAADTRVANLPVDKAFVPDARDDAPPPTSPKSHAALAVSVVLGVAGVGAGVVGGAFGWMSRSGRDAFNAALMQGMPVTAYTVDGATALSAQVRTGIIIANVLFGAAAVLVAAAIAVLVFGS